MTSFIISYNLCNKIFYRHNKIRVENNQKGSGNMEKYRKTSSEKLRQGIKTGIVKALYSEKLITQTQFNRISEKIYNESGIR